MKAIKEYAATHQIKIVNVYREEGVSGPKDLENRPALMELMTALHSNGVRLVLVEKLDRLARDLMIQETIIGDLRKNGFDFISAAEPDLLQDDPSRKLMRQIFGAIAEYEKTTIVLKLRGARLRTKAKDGWSIAGILAILLTVCICFRRLAPAEKTASDGLNKSE